MPTFPPPRKCESHCLAGFACYHWFDPTTNQMLSTLVSSSGPVELWDVNAPLINTEEEEQEAAEEEVALGTAFTVLVPCELTTKPPTEFNTMTNNPTILMREQFLLEKRFNSTTKSCLTYHLKLVKMFMLNTETLTGTVRVLQLSTE
jgi:hypothetical protein